MERDIHSEDERVAQERPAREPTAAAEVRVGDGYSDPAIGAANQERVVAELTDRGYTPDGSEGPAGLALALADMKGLLVEFPEDADGEPNEGDAAEPVAQPDSVQTAEGQAEPAAYDPEADYGAYVTELSAWDAPWKDYPKRYLEQPAVNLEDDDWPNQL